MKNRRIRIKREIKRKQMLVDIVKKYNLCNEKYSWLLKYIYGKRKIQIKEATHTEPLMPFR